MNDIRNKMREKNETIFGCVFVICWPKHPKLFEKICAMLVQVAHSSHMFYTKNILVECVESEKAIFFKCHLHRLPHPIII